jgi:hypothetical protein
MKEPHTTCKVRTNFGPIILDKSAVYDGEWVMGLRDGNGK